MLGVYMCNFCVYSVGMQQEDGGRDGMVGTDKSRWSGYSNLRHSMTLVV